MDQKEVVQKERLKEFDKYIKAFDPTKYGYVFDYGPVTRWVSEATGNRNEYVWKQVSGYLSFQISVSPKFPLADGSPGYDYLSAAIVDTRKENSYMLFNSYEETEKHPLHEMSHNWENKTIEEFTKNYLKALTEALDTYLSDFIMGRKFEADKWDRGDY